MRRMIRKAYKSFCYNPAPALCSLFAAGGWAIVLYMAAQQIGK